MKKITGIACFRDLGGIACADGKKVISGTLFRSGHLGKLHAKAAKKLHLIHHITHIVDLRSNSEVKDVPDIISDSVSYHRFPPLDDEKNPSITPKNRLKILKKLMAKDGGTKQHLCDIYRTMVTLPESVRAYRSLIRLLLDNKDGAILWHCTQGKDRTGLGSAIILLALGANKDAIIEDYINYNSYCNIKNKIIFAAVTLLKFNTHMAKELNNLMTAQVDYIKAAFDELEKRYGSTDGFLKNALLLNDKDICKLRAMYLA